MKINRGEWILFFLAWAIVLYGVVCYGAAPRADVLTFVGSTDGKAATQTPSVPADIQIDANAPKVANTTAYVAAIVLDGKPKLLWFRVDVKIDGKPIPPVPPPVPPVPPVPPTPPPGSKYKLMIFVESAKLISMPKAQRDMLASLKFRVTVKDKGHLLLGVYDPVPDKSPSAEYQPWFAAVVGKALPQAAIVPLTNQTPKAVEIRTFALPADEAGTLSLLEKGGL